MIRQLSLPIFLSVTMLGPLLEAAGSKDLSAATFLAAGSSQDQGDVEPSVPARSNEQAPSVKSNDGKVAVTRSDGSTGRSKVPDQKEIKKLVGYMRDGINRADRAERQRTTRRVIQYRPGRNRK